MLVDCDIAKSEAMFADDGKKLKHKTVGTIRQRMDGSVLHHMSNKILAIVSKEAKKFLWEENIRQQSFLN